MKRKLRSLSVFVVLIAFAALFSARSAAAQDWFKTGTGLGVTKARLAVPDTVARSTFGPPLPKVFHDTLWADLEYSGIIDMVSPSFYPLTDPGQPSDLKAPDWAAAPANAYMVAYGNLSLDSSGMAFAGYLSDVHNPTAPLALQKIYRGAPTENDARRMAHQFADDIIALLSGGQPGIAQTQIAFVSGRGGNKEIWVMDYDGANQHQITHLNSISLTPRWSPDATPHRVHVLRPISRRHFGADLHLFDGFQSARFRFRGFAGRIARRHGRPTDQQIAFMSSINGDPEIYVANADGTHLHRVTFGAGVAHHRRGIRRPASRWFS